MQAVVLVILALLSSVFAASNYTRPGLNVQLSSSSPEIYPDFTKDLRLNCSAHQEVESGLAAVTSLILSRRSQQNEPESRLAAVTVLSRDSVRVTSSLGAHVTGRLLPRDGGYIQFQWRYPQSEVSGVYECSAHGIDQYGNPRSYISTQTIRTGRVGMSSLLEQMKNIREKQELLTYNVSETQTHLLTGALNQQEKTKERLDEALDEINKLNQDLNVTKEKLVETMNGLKKTKENLHTTTERLDQEIVSKEKIKHLIYSLTKSTEHKNHVYILISSTPNFDTSIAQKSCEEYGGYLAEINDADELKAIVDLYIKTKTTTYAYIGISDEENEGQWKTLHSGGVMTYLPWASDQPNGGSGENCAAIEHGSLRLYDRPCKFETGDKFVCEIELI